MFKYRQISIQIFRTVILAQHYIYLILKRFNNKNSRAKKQSISNPKCHVLLLASIKSVSGFVYIDFVHF